MRYLPLFALLTLFSFPTAAYSGGEFPFAPPADSALGRQLHTRIQQAQAQQKTDRLTTIQQKLAQVEKEFAPKYLSWNESVGFRRNETAPSADGWNAKYFYA